MLDPDESIHVLVVDDDRLFRELLTRRLEREGYLVDTAINGNEAKSIIAEKGPRLIVTDWVMPETDGLELCRWIRDAPGIAFTYVIILTAHDTESSVIQAFAAGADDFLTKPYKEAEMIARLRAAERIIRLEESYQTHMAEAHRANAELAVKNSELKRLSKALRESREQLDEMRLHAEAANRAKSEFLANVSHEIRTPMTAILGYAEILASELELSADQEAMQTIVRNGEKLLEIVNDLLELSRIDSGNAEIRVAPINLRKLVEETVQLVRNRISSDALQFTSKIDPNIPETVSLDANRVRQILVNLIGNSIKFTPSGNIELAVHCEGTLGTDPHVVFDVTDSGIGMVPDLAAMVFEPFTQGDGTVTRPHGGLGLGLALSRRSANLLGGQVEIVRTAPGQGTQIRLTLPTAGPKASNDSATDIPADTEPSTAHPQRPLEGRRILIADDGPESRRVLQFQLGKLGAITVAAENGLDAVQLASDARERGKAFDLILMDMNMPIMDGHSATRRLRKAGDDTCIIAMIPNAISHDQTLCTAAGCNAYVSKPIDMDSLIDVLERVIRQRDATCEGAHLS